MWTAWDMWTDDPEYDEERFDSDPIFESWDERIDRMRYEHELSGRYFIRED